MGCLTFHITTPLYTVSPSYAKIAKEKGDLNSNSIAGKKIDNINITTIRLPHLLIKIIITIKLQKNLSK
jgi:hypothetical protein